MLILLKSGILVLGLIGLIWGEPMCSVDDPRLDGWDNPEQYISEECKYEE